MAPFTSWRKSSFSEGAGSACVEVAWRKSTFSEGAGSDCVEVGWRKSSFSEGGGSDCVEVGFVDTLAAVRDSKNVSGPVITLPHASWAAFLTALPRSVGGRS